MIVMSGLFTHAWFFWGSRHVFTLSVKQSGIRMYLLVRKIKRLQMQQKCFFLPSFCFSVLDVFIISDANSVSFFPILEVFRLLRQHRRHRVCMRRTAYRPEKTTCLDSMEYSSTLKVYYPAFWWRNFTTSRRFRSALYGSSIIIWYMIDICLRVKQSLVQLTETSFEVNSKRVVTERNPKGVPSQYNIVPVQCTCLFVWFLSVYIYIYSVFTFCKFWTYMHCGA